MQSKLPSAFNSNQIYLIVLRESCESQFLISKQIRLKKHLIIDRLFHLCVLKLIYSSSVSLYRVNCKSYTFFENNRNKIMFHGYCCYILFWCYCTHSSDRFSNDWKKSMQKILSATASNNDQWSVVMHNCTKAESALCTTVYQALCVRGAASIAIFNSLYYVCMCVCVWFCWPEQSTTKCELPRKATLYMHISNYVEFATRTKAK